MKAESIHPVIYWKKGEVITRTLHFLVSSCEAPINSQVANILLILSRFRSVTMDGVLIGWSDLLHLIHSQLETAGNIAHRWSTLFTVHSYTRTRVLSLDLSFPGNGFIIISLSLQITHGFLTAKLLSCHYSTAANSENSTEFNSSAPKFIFR
jgi:hypothetical protein